MSDLQEQSGKSGDASGLDLSTPPYVIFSLKERRFAISTDFVQEMLLLPEVTPVPNMPPHIRGVINLRGQIIHLVDSRVLMEMPSYTQDTDELIDMLVLREQEHKQWLDELESCLREEREFKLAICPHQCKFGQWYDHFKTDNTMLSSELRKFDKPHKQIHATAKAAIDLKASGKSDEAFRLIERRKSGELATMIKLFDNTRKILKDTQREIAIVLTSGRNRLSVSADSVDSVERIDSSSIEASDGATQHTATGTSKCKFGKRAKGDEWVSILEPRHFGLNESMAA